MRDPTPPQFALHPTTIMTRTSLTTTPKHTRTRPPRPLLLPPTPPVRSRRATTIVRWFGLGAAMDLRTSENCERQAAPAAVDLAPSTITLVTGPSGAGKSSLLRDLQRAANALDAHGETIWIDLGSVELPDAPV